MIVLNVIKLHPNATLPAYMSDGAAGMDIASVENVIIRPQCTTTVRTGIAIEVPDGYEAQVRSRSGLAANHSISVLNSPGTIDSDYRGEVLVLLSNHSRSEFLVTSGMRIAQLVVAPVTRVTVKLASSSTTTKRGNGGLGSTGL